MDRQAKRANRLGAPPAVAVHHFQFAADDKVICEPNENTAPANGRFASCSNHLSTPHADRYLLKWLMTPPCGVPFLRDRQFFPVEDSRVEHFPISRNIAPSLTRCRTPSSSGPLGMLSEASTDICIPPSQLMFPSTHWFLASSALVRTAATSEAVEQS